MLNHSASPPHPPPPVKKKRTRTLTTPQQSAALHALLAQSRFPTTAMREQVGRSIGLSARKVQVWFQNQRQKARRPRDSKNQGSPVAPARPPQYGAFPNVPVAPFLHSSASSTVNPPSLPSDELYATTRSASAPFVHFNANRAQQQPATSSGRLSGPGVPGAASSSSSSFTAPPHFPHTPQLQQQPQMQTLPPLADPSPQARSPLTRDVHSISSASSARQVMPSRDFTFNHPFPPLHLQVPETSGVLGAGQNQYPTMIPLRPLTASSHRSLALSSNTSSGRPRSQYSSSSSSSSPPSPPSPFAPASASVSGSRPQTPVSSFLVPRHRDLPRLRIVPLHVPESPHTNTHANNTDAHASVHVHVHVQRQPQRSALPRYSPPPLSLPPDPTRFSHSQPPSDRALPSLFRSTSSTSRGDEISPVPAAHASISESSSYSSRARRFDPVREAASECSRSGSLGTDSSMSTGTPPRIDTPKRLTTSF
jgi:hypothetical protein